MSTKHFPEDCDLHSCFCHLVGEDAPWSVIETRLQTHPQREFESVSLVLWLPRCLNGHPWGRITWDSMGGDVVWLMCASRKRQQSQLGLKNVDWDFPGGPAIKTSPSNVGSVGSIPGRGSKTPHASRPKNWNMNQKQYCNRFSKDFKNGPREKQNENEQASCFTVDTYIQRLPWWLSGKKKYTCNAEDSGSIPGSGRSLGKGHGNPL